MDDLYNRIDFIVSGGALKLLTDFLDSKGLPALVLEPDGEDFKVLDAVGTVPTSLVVHDKNLHLQALFSSRPPLAAFEVEEAEGNEQWPYIIRMRGAYWEIYILLGKKPEASLVPELQSYAGLVRIWRTFQRIDETEKQLSRLSYMILATKSTLASIFEPMPLPYFASFLSDVLHESLFPKHIVILKDEKGSLVVYNGETEAVPAREGIYTELILPPTPIVTKKDAAPFEIVLPVVEGDCRLFCVMTWDELPDAQMMNFMELLGNLAVRAVVINNLRAQNQRAESTISTGEFTILSLSNVLKILRGAADKKHFLSLLAEIFIEQCRMPDCSLAVWDSTKGGYAEEEKRSGQFEAEPSHEVLPASEAAPVTRTMETVYDLEEKELDAILKSWGLGECPWEDVRSMRFLFPICDDKILVGMIAMGSPNGRAALDRGQVAAVHLIAQFAAYEFRRFLI
ncbi:MAG: hypothetical protein IJU98_00500 [Synergistaceae bacterium]|nr:hypothetical protein [Synergistaceae bacterium]